MITRRLPLKSLEEGRWFKLICGASYQHLPSIRSLVLAYGLAGADCVDVAADPAVVTAVRDAFQALSHLGNRPDVSLPPGISFPAEQPLLMVSFSDGEDPHFRKATFDPRKCPPSCPRPCESVCPTAAIVFADGHTGIQADRCYGCGRCVPLCPWGHINTLTHTPSLEAIASQILPQVDALELHTQVGRYDAFMALWSTVRPYLSELTLISISCPEHDGVIDYLWQLYRGISPVSLPLIWQTDGRSMSGDLGRGTTHTTLKYGRRVLRAGPPGFVQLAGGTNSHTVTKLHQLTVAENSWADPQGPGQPGSPGPKPAFGGVAYGSFARRLLSPLIDELSPQPDSASADRENVALTPHPLCLLETSPAHLTRALHLAQSLVLPLKTVQNTGLTPPSSIGRPLSHAGGFSHSPSYPLSE